MPYASSAGQYCTEYNVLIVPMNISDHTSGREKIAPGVLDGNGAMTMPLSYLDLFLAFLGLALGLPSVLPRLFFQDKNSRRRTSQAD
jgi:hypothetical protein